MCIYCPTSNYRKIYENHFGPIPKDELGRSFEIHHIDGNRSNNQLSNLRCVSLQEHYDVHYLQSDWIACHLIGLKLKLTGDKISELASKNVRLQLADGRHPWQKRPDGTSNASDRVAAGTHHLLNRDAASERNKKRVVKGNHPFMIRPDGSSVSKDKVVNGTHNFLGGSIQRRTNSKMLENGTHPSQKVWSCEHCGKIGKGASNYTKNHGKSCKKLV